ncbi:MAG: hypothetical protein K0R09_2035 [Clostridiales bacterium]|jgi:hypothetical protein|nr:hypothetical protein [Clostridiales bacterium]
MRKFISVLLSGLFIITNLNACKLEKRGSNPPEDVQKGEISTDVQKVESAASVQDIKMENEEIAPGEYTKDDEQSLTKGGRLSKYNNIIVYIGEATGHIFMKDLKSKELKEISQHRPDSLYFDGEWVFYSVKGDKNGIYRLGLDGSALKISEDYSLQMCIYKDKLYYTKQIGHDPINGTPQGEFYRVDFDGQNKTKLLGSNVKNYFKIHNGWIYYTRLDNRSLNRAKLDGSMDTLLAKGRTLIQLVTDNNVYYTDYSNNAEALHKLNLNNGQNETIGPWSRVLKDEDKVYIQTRRFNKDKVPEDNYSISMVDEEKDEVIKLLTLIDLGLDISIAVKGDWIYFGDYRINLKDTACKKEMMCRGYIHSLYGEYGYYTYYGDGTISDFHIKRVKLQEPQNLYVEWSYTGIPEVEIISDNEYINGVEFELIYNPDSSQYEFKGGFGDCDRIISYTLTGTEFSLVLDGKCDLPYPIPASVGINRIMNGHGSPANEDWCKQNTPIVKDKDGNHSITVYFDEAYPKGYITHLDFSFGKID